MKKKPPIQCKNAAQRVKFLFSRGKETLDSNEYKDKKKAEKSKFNSIEPPKLPESLKNISAGVLRAELRKKTKKSPHKTFQPAYKQETAQFFKSAVESVPSKGELDPKRIRGLKLKEHILAERKLKELSKNKKSSIKKFEAILMNEDDGQSLEDKKQFDQWDEIIKSKETRYFQIGRVIKFLSD